MSDPALGMTMLGLIVVAIMMGFPTAFTLMGLGMIFGYIAFWAPGQYWYDNRIFDLIVQRTYGVMTNDTLLSVPTSKAYTSPLPPAPVSPGPFPVLAT